VPIEYPLNEYSSKASANKGESYISHYGNDWEDITKRQGLEDTNICIKAFTDNPLNVDIPYDKMHFFENTNVKLVAETVDKDGRILDIASAADWQSSNATVGCVNPAGEFVATNEGTTVLTVNYGSFNDNMVMTVTDSEISDNKAIADRKYELRSQIFEGDTQGTVTCLTFPAFYQDTKTLQGTEKLSFLITETGNSAAINEGDLVNSTEIK
jgi:hypothetical protein